MPLDIKTLGSIVQSNLELAKRIRASALTVDQAADAVEAARQRMTQTIQIQPTCTLNVAFVDKDSESRVMAQVVELQAAIEASAGDPAAVGILRVDLANQFLNLANLPNGAVASIIQFTPADTADIAALMQRAKLDSAQRKLVSSVLNAAVGLAQAALKVAAIVAA